MTFDPVIAPDVDHLPTRDGYDRWAAIYDVEGNPLVAIEEPHVDALLDDVRGLAVLDLGCGTGRHTLRLAQRGANVTAIDFSDAMLRKAREKFASALPLPSGEGWGESVRSIGTASASDASPRAQPSPLTPLPRDEGDRCAPTARFIQHDLAAALPLPDRSFDRVLCGLVLDHIADLGLLFREMRRVCKPAPTGWIVVSVMHPAMMLRGVQARFTDPATGRETRPASVANQISDYVMAAMRAGLHIEHISEHAVDAELARNFSRAEKYLGWPLLLMMRLRA